MRSIDDIYDFLVTEYNWEHSYPDYPVEDWQYAVQNHETRQGYWHWVAEQIQQDENVDLS